MFDKDMPDRGTRSHAGAAQMYDAYMSARHFGSLDGLRFICIMLVLWHHAPISGPVREAYPVFGRGFVGVDFFFVLSGFLITTLLLREETRDGSFSLKGFYWRRALRILPVYFLVVSIVGFYVVLVQGQYHKAELLPYYYLFLSNFINDHLIMLDPTWSLSVEEQYYLIWPALLLLAPRKLIVPILLILVAANVLGSMEVFAPLGARSIAVNWAITLKLPNATYAPILMGSLVAILLNKRAVFEWIAPVMMTRYTSVVGLLSVFVALAVLPWNLLGWPNLVLHSLMCFALMSLVMREDHVLHGVLNRRFIVRTGQISYGLYLYHQFGLYFALLMYQRFGIADLLSGTNVLLFVTIVYIVLSYVISEISFRTLERYFHGLR